MPADLILQVVLDEDVKKLSKLSANIISSFANDFEAALQKQSTNRQARPEDVPGEMLGLDYLFYLGLTDEGDAEGPDFRKSTHLLDRPNLADELPG